MVDPEKQNRALHALQRVLVFTRAMALDGQGSERIAAVLDWAEVLPKLLASEQNQTCEFRDALNAIAEKEPCFKAAVSAFDWPEPIRW
ncbi:MAG TPA: hypothetical protein VIM11_24175 [Tepidisphaeraceae bacterium]|jgi:hypothetical protein